MDNTSSKRLISIDALRGLDMLFIMGGAGLFAAFNDFWPCTFTDFIKVQMEHVDWNGFAIMDMVFPLFLFIAGISFPFSYAKSLSLGKTKPQIHWKIVKRMLILVFLGLAYGNLFNLNFSHLRIPSVLGRIGIAWAVAAVLFVNCNKTVRYSVAGALLIGYWLLITLVSAPDVANADPLSFEGNLVGYIDRILMPGHLYEGSFDPEGLLSTLPAIVTALLGMFTGELIQKAKSHKEMLRSAGIIALAGAILIIIGLIWDLNFPINKKLWSSSYVCFVGGISMLLFSVFYYIIDIKGHSKWCFFFRVIGLNSITIYMLQRIFDMDYTTRFFSRGIVNLFPEPYQGLVYSIFYIAVCWGILYFLYKKKIFIKV